MLSGRAGLGTKQKGAGPLTKRLTQLTLAKVSEILGFDIGNTQLIK